MALRTDDDPYPSSLPRMGSPDMSYHPQSSTAPVHHPLDQLYLDSSTNANYGFDSVHPFSEAIKMPLGVNEKTVHPAALALDYFPSPESSASSSRSSGEHRRHPSSNSSRSATFEFGSLVPDAAQMNKLKLEGYQSTFEPAKRNLDTMAAQSDIDQQMNELFDFDSAANSPGDSVTKEAVADKPIAGMVMPQDERSPQQSDRPILHPHNRRRPATSRSVASTPSSFKPQSPWGHSAAQILPFGFTSSTTLQDRIPHTPLYGASAAPALAANPGFVGPGHFVYSQPTFFPQTNVFHDPAHFQQRMGPRLQIHPIPPKTRVETQIPITMTLVSLPPNITKLHLPTRTIAKPKLLAKHQPGKSPDMLELDVMPVCASALKKPGVLLRAYAIARGEGMPTVSGQINQRQVPDIRDSTGNQDQRIDPMDGGPIRICDGCMLRERKRANRRMEKEVSEEDIRWKQGEKERIVVFNETEIVDWKAYGSPDLNEPASRRARGGGRGKKKSEGGESILTTVSQPAINIPYPELAKQVRLLMRITCYCRHQGESEGFQVIVTLKDHRGNCVAQEISSPILITDDHKTSTLQNENRLPMTGNEAPLPGGSFLSAAPSGNAGTGPQMYNMSQSHSTTELPVGKLGFDSSNPHRSATSASFQQLRQVPGSISPSITTCSQNPSHRTSATLTPRNLSRQVSPSALSGPTPKRRKASQAMSHRSLVDLSMTQMQSIDTSMGRRQSPSTSPVSSSDMSEGLTMAPIETPSSRGNATDRNGFTFPSRQSVPPREHFSDSDSMPGLAVSNPSGGQSPPAALTQPSTEMAAHAHALHHSLLHVSGAQRPQTDRPTIVRVIPCEGPKSGGIDVTVLGEGFPDNVDVLFADAVATRTIVMNSQTLVCTIPPSYQAGFVQLSLRGLEQPDPQVWFRYNDTDEADLMKLALAVLHHRNTGKLAHAGDIARSIIGGQQSQDNQQNPNGTNGTDHSHNSETAAMDLELSVLGVIDLIDQTDSAVTPFYSLSQNGGQTMLHLSASLGYHRLVAGLLARGMNPDLRDRNGLSAMHMACFHGHTKVIRKLLSAGADSTLRSWLGLTPTDMATTLTVRQLLSSTRSHTRSRSVGATPISQLSRASSFALTNPTWCEPFRDQNLMNNSKASFNNNNTLIESYQSRPSTPAEAWVRSRRNSASDPPRYLPVPAIDDPVANNHLVAAAAAMAAARDNFAAQIQYFQQSVQQTLPNLQIPHLPPLPNFEAYQGHPMVRRISSLVPRMNSSPAPPPYEEVFPETMTRNKNVEKASAADSMGDTLTHKKCSTDLDPTEVDPRSLMKVLSEASTEEQQERLRLARAMGVKCLSKDRKLFFIWIPLLILVVIAMIKDVAPSIFVGAIQVFKAVQQYIAA